MITNKNGWYKNYFDKKKKKKKSTLDSNSTWGGIPGAEVINDFNEDFLKAYFRISASQDINHRPHLPNVSPRANVSIIICSQMYKQLNKTTRSRNLSGMFVLKVNKKDSGAFWPP
jgi:hypothetical protein